MRALPTKWRRKPAGIEITSLSPMYRCFILQRIRQRLFIADGKKSPSQMTDLVSSNVIADMLLSGRVQCIQKLVKLIFGLALEHGQQLLALDMFNRITSDRLHLSVIDNFVCIQPVQKTGILDIEAICQVIVMIRDSSPVSKFFLELCCKHTGF